MPGATATGVAGGTGYLAKIFSGNPLDIGLTPEQAKAKNDKRRSLEYSHNPGGSSREQDQRLKSMLRGGGGTAAKFDTSALDGFVEKAGDAKE